MENNYSYETIEECEKAIVSKTMDMDIAFLANRSLFECFVRTIRTIMIWVIMLVPLSLRIFFGFKEFIICFGILVAIYIVGALLMSWVKFNFNNEHSKLKIDIVKYMISECKEYIDLNQSEDIPDWQLKQITKRMANKGKIDVSWDNDK